MKKTWMWPQTSINSTTVKHDIEVLTEIEKYFCNLYAPYKVVYFSRARVALMAISKVRNLSREQLTFVQPFSSHCVLSSISYQSTPTTTQPQASDQQIVYHQWGQKTEVNQNNYKNVLVEDAVDSIILTNEKSELFPNNAPFCVISLPKILPISVGSIVICQQNDDYQKLIAQRLAMEIDIGSSLENINFLSFQEATLQAKPCLVPIIKESIQTLFESSVSKIQLNLVYMRRVFSELALTCENLNKRCPSNIVIQTSK